MEIELIFGNVLRSGIRTDMTIHPQLIVHFDKPQNTDFVFRISSVITKFLQFVHRKKNYNLKNFELYHKRGERVSHIGYMFSSLYDPELRPSSRLDASFRFYGEKIGKLLSLISSESGFPINHLHDKYHDVYHYTVERFGMLCAAFEYECSKMPDLYETVGNEVDNIRKMVLEQLKGIEPQDEAEKDFLKGTFERINSFGTKRGLRNKILHAYQQNASALVSSMDYILFRERSPEKVSRLLAELRGKVLHHEVEYQFNDQEMEAIRFLEILQFVMTLRRAGYTEKEIEVITGALYHCNSLYYEQ